MIDQFIATKYDEIAVPTISEQDKTNFLKSVIADVPYTETFSILDGQHNITFRAMSVDEHNDWISQIKLDQKNEVADNNDAYFVQVHSYRLGLSIVSIDGKPFVNEITKENFKADEKSTYVAARAEGFKKWSSFKLSIYLSVFGQFQRKILELGKEIQTPDFWIAST